MKISLLADECVYKTTVDFLRSQGFDISAIQEVGMAGYADKDVIAVSCEKNRVLLTADLDFSNILIYPPRQYSGIVILKISKAVEKEVHSVLLKMLQEVAPDQFDKSLIIVDSNKYRIRKER